ncbi:MAG: hypothetical protein ACO1N5_03570 [Noviherbaspirillum sp.]
MVRSSLMVAMVCLTGAAQAASLGNAGWGNMLGALAGRSGGGPRGETVDATLADISADFNRRTPLRVGDGTVLERVSAEPGRKLTYHYTLLRVRQDDLAPGEFQHRAAPALRQQVCASPGMQALLRSGITVSYAYSGSDGAALGLASFDPDDCG